MDINQWQTLYYELCNVLRIYNLWQRRKLAELDVDDTTGYGPETITLYDLNGVYRYTVKDFRRTRTLQQYGATVKVYLPGQAQPEVITVAPNAGLVNIWEVFELDHGELRILNRAGNENSTR